MTNIYTLFILIFIINFCSPLAHGEIYETYRGSRSVGMGGADTAVVNDETALLINPAGLGKLRDSIGTVFAPEIETGENVNLLTSVIAGGSFTDLNTLKSVLSSYKSKHYHYKFQIFPSYVIKNFGIGFLVKESVDASLSSDGSTLTADYFYDWILPLGFNFRFWDGRIKLGTTAKMINRVQASGDFDPTTSLKIRTIGKEGQGTGFDAGLLLTLPWATLPTLSVVVRDIGNTKLKSKGMVYKLAQRPDPILQDADVALAFFPIHTNATRSSFTLEYKHLLQASTYADRTSELYHVGWELNFADAAFFRLGINGKYYTTGFELSSERTQLQLAYYGEEVLVNNSFKADYRWNVRYAYRF